MHDFIPVIALMIPIVSIIGAFVMIVYLRRFENSERLSMIEKGVSPDAFRRPRRADTGLMSASLLFIGSGIGLLFGYLLDEYAGIPEPLPYFSMVLIFGGAGLGLSYMINERKIAKDRTKEG